MICTRVTLAGLSDFCAKVTVSSEYGMMSIFSPRNSRMMDCTRIPFMPTQAPTGIDVLVAALHGDLGAFAGLAGRGANLHGAVVDFRHFHLKQALHQHGVGARNDDLRAFGGAVHRANHHAQTIAQIVGFQSRLLALGQARFGAAHVHDDVGAFKALDDAIHQLADAAVVFVVDGVALGLAHLLHDDLLGGLRGDAAQHGSGLGNQQFAADFRCGD